MDRGCPMIAGRFEITIDEVDELVEAIAMRTASRLAAILGHDPDAPLRSAEPPRPRTGNDTVAGRPPPTGCDPS
jgi:hypothetical protein